MRDGLKTSDAFGANRVAGCGIDNDLPRSLLRIQVGNCG